MPDTSEAKQDIKPEVKPEEGDKIIKQHTLELTEVFSASFPADINCPATGGRE